MTNTELAELFITLVYDEAESKGHHTQVFLDEIAKKFGVTDQSKVINVAKYLDSRGLIKGIFRINETYAMITGDGAIFVERGGDTGIIPKYRANPTSFIVNIDSSTTIYGNVSNSNIATHSPNVNQTISFTPEIEGIFSQIFEVLRKDPTLSQELLADAIQDIETLKLQIAKTNKNKTTIESILSTLSNISSIASLVAQLGPLIFR